MAWMLAGVLLHLGQGGLPMSLKNGLISAAFIWVGFVITTMVVNYAFHGARHALTLIDGGHWLGVLLLQGDPGLVGRQLERRADRAPAVVRRSAFGY
jgi:hypothetical protein